MIPEDKNKTVVIGAGHIGPGRSTAHLIALMKAHKEPILINMEMEQDEETLNRQIKRLMGADPLIAGREYPFTLHNTHKDALPDPIVDPSEIQNDRRILNSNQRKTRRNKKRAEKRARRKNRRS